MSRAAPESFQGLPPRVVYMVSQLEDSRYLYLTWRALVDGRKLRPQRGRLDWSETLRDGPEEALLMAMQGSGFRMNTWGHLHVQEREIGTGHPTDATASVALYLPGLGHPDEADEWDDDDGALTMDPEALEGLMDKGMELFKFLKESWIELKPPEAGAPPAADPSDPFGGLPPAARELVGNVLGELQQMNQRVRALEAEQAQAGAPQDPPDEGDPGADPD